MPQLLRLTEGFYVQFKAPRIRIALMKVFLAKSDGLLSDVDWCTFYWFSNTLTVACIDILSFSVPLIIFSVFSSLLSTSLSLSGTFSLNLFFLSFSLSLSLSILLYLVLSWCFWKSFSLFLFLSLSLRLFISICISLFSCLSLCFYHVHPGLLICAFYSLPFL